MSAEIILLKIRNLIADKDIVSAQANRDLSLDGWRMDYTAWHSQLSIEIETLFNTLEQGDTLNKQVAASNGLSCPNCDNEGFIPEQDGFGEWYKQQCEFCHTVKDSVFNRKKEQS